ncbi:SDR family NAD(P)-dependent oxidoreductase [Stakelama sp. CBK3Z-3]|uniref:SDR family NAD(P)-dependent oxidoreductase n=1 Tax=Stakelama flava TaxID=2860338 RepID=A0ABS6XIS5_9SPHN|nr:SDR family NAD(P)-dependent oxidoreductase [Stakelama flava]MBW4330036.1 SDR family NAD(P)-dependent oxidoreductase [Stakelama flava]
MSQDRVWFITGASRGFGRIWTEAALKRGERVAATVRDPSSMKDLASAYPDTLLVLTLDVTDRKAVFEAVGRAHDHFGRLDVVICNAGYAYMGAVEELDFAAAKANFETNVFGTLSVIQAVLPLLRAQGSGHIITLSSIGGVVGFPTGGSYVASKFAVEAFTEALAGEVGSFGIKVTMLEPGSYATSFRSSTTAAPAMVEYDTLRQSMRAGFKPEDTGNPLATADVIARLVDTPEPPLRLVLGSTTIPVFRSAYEQRLKDWDEWTELSNAAQG